MAMIGAAQENESGLEGWGSSAQDRRLEEKCGLVEQCSMLCNDFLKGESWGGKGQTLENFWLPDLVTEKWQELWNAYSSRNHVLDDEPFQLGPISNCRIACSCSHVLRHT